MQLDDVAIGVDAPDHPIGWARESHSSHLDRLYRATVVPAPLGVAGITANEASRTAALFRAEP
jgi:hypothetical protein